MDKCEKHSQEKESYVSDARKKCFWIFDGTFGAAACIAEALQRTGLTRSLTENHTHFVDVFKSLFRRESLGYIKVGVYFQEINFLNFFDFWNLEFSLKSGSYCSEMTKISVLTTFEPHFCVKINKV